MSFGGTVWADVPSYMQQDTFPRASGSLWGDSLKAANNAGWTNVWGDTWTNPAKPGQYMSSNQLQNMLNTRSDLSSRMNAGNYNPGVDYMAAIQPYLNPSEKDNGYETQLNALMANPDSIKDSASYKFSFDQGKDAVERSAAAKGMLGSGNVLAELTKFGQGLASQRYDNEANRLAGLATTQKNYLSNRGQLALSAAKSKSDDYWNAQNMANSFAMNSGYGKQNVW